MLAARLVVTHVFSYPIVTQGMIIEHLPEMRKQALKTHRTKLEDFCKAHLGQEWKTKKIQIAPVEDLAILDGVLAIAADWHAKLIVVGLKFSNFYSFNIIIPQKGYCLERF